MIRFKAYQQPFGCRKVTKLDNLIDVLPADESEIEFDAFIAAGRAVGANVALWVKAKHQGRLSTRITDDGRHLVKRGAPAQQAVS